MAKDLVLDPTTCAVVTMEMQRGIVGDLATMPALAAQAEHSGTINACARLVEAARLRAVPVVHATVSWRADRRGTTFNTPLARHLSHNPDQILEGTPAVDLVPEFGDCSRDLVCHRHHGMTPFTGTTLDATLRSVGTTTVIATGVSVNVGVMGLVLSAVDLGYRVIVCSDAVTGLPADYCDAVLRHTFSTLATVSTTANVIEGLTA